MKFISNEVLEKIIKENENDNFHFEDDKIVIDGEMYLARNPYFYNGVLHTTKSSANSLIKKEPEFDYNFCEEMYETFMSHGIDTIRYARPKNKCCKRDFNYMIDLYSAYPHVLKYEKLPIAGNFYTYEDSTKMNFYKYAGKYFREDCIVTDDLKNLIESDNLGVCEFLFSTDYKVGSKIGDKLIDMVYKNKRTKADAKNIHYGYYQKRYLQYNMKEDCYVRNEKQTHELLMVAVCSQLAYIMYKIFTYAESCSDYNFVTDAYFFNTLNIDKFVKNMKNIPNYDYRIYDCTKKGADDTHGTVIYKSYPDLPDAPRNHHKK